MTFWKENDRFKVVGGTAFENGSMGKVLKFTAKTLWVEVGGIQKRILKRSVEVVLEDQEKTSNANYHAPHLRPGFLPNHALTRPLQNPPAAKQAATKKKRSAAPEAGQWKRGMALPSPMIDPPIQPVTKRAKPSSPWKRNTPLRPSFA
jgi:hypothetical protein